MAHFRMNDRHSFTKQNHSMNPSSRKPLRKEHHHISRQNDQNFKIHTQIYHKTRSTMKHVTCYQNDGRIYKNRQRETHKTRSEFNGKTHQCPIVSESLENGKQGKARVQLNQAILGNRDKNPIPRQCRRQKRTFTTNKKSKHFRDRSSRTNKGKSQQTKGGSLCKFKMERYQNYYGPFYYAFKIIARRSVKTTCHCIVYEDSTFKI